MVHSKNRRVTLTQVELSQLQLLTYLTLLVSGAMCAMSRSYAEERFPCSRFIGWGWLLMCHASSAQHGCRCGLESITKASSQAVVWPLLMACSATAEAEKLALLRSNLYLAEGDQVGVRVAPHTGYQGAGFGFLSSKGYQLSHHSCIFGEGSLLYTWTFLNAPVIPNTRTWVLVYQDIQKLTRTLGHLGQIGTMKTIKFPTYSMLKNQCWNLLLDFCRISLQETWYCSTHFLTFLKHSI